MHSNVYKKRFNKTQKVLRIIFTILRSKNYKVSQEHLHDLLNNTSTSQKYKIIKELLEGSKSFPAVLQTIDGDLTFSNQILNLLPEKK